MEPLPSRRRRTLERPEVVQLWSKCSSKVPRFGRIATEHAEDRRVGVIAAQKIQSVPGQTGRSR